MDFHDWTTRTKGGTIGAASVFVLILAGCGSAQRSQMEYLPGEQHLVGGGFLIDWEAPVPGTVYLIEKQTGKIVETRTLAEGEAYTFEVSSIVQAEELEELLGIDFAKTRFLLYFEPAKDLAQ